MNFAVFIILRVIVQGKRMLRGVSLAILAVLVTLSCSQAWHLKPLSAVIAVRKLLKNSAAPIIVGTAFALTGYEAMDTQGFTNPSPMVAVAAESVLSGQYDDPNHPGCLRKITVKYDIVTIIGSDNVDGSKQWVLKAKEDAPGVIFVDFSPKGGPSDLLGVYNEKADAIKWPDGNSWTKIKSK